MRSWGEGRVEGRARRRGAALLGTVVAGLAAGTASVLLSASPVSACSTAALLGDTGGVDTIEANAQQDFVTRLNELRRSKGLGNLVWNGALAAPAISWSEQMSSANRLYHARDTGAGDGVEPSQDYVTINSRIIANWQRLAENVGVSGMYTSCTMAELESNTAKAVEGLHRAFVASSGHYANMVGDHNQVGIGVHIDADELWVTVRFAKGDLPAAGTGSASTIVTKATGAYVDAIYQLFGGRAATAAEKSYWAPAVASGNRLALTSALSVTDSWAGTRLNDLYQTVFERSADAGGRAYWLDQIRRGLTLESAGVEFYRSAEYFQRSGGTNASWIGALYRDLLGRSADGGGVAYWVGQLERGGQPRSAVAANFYRSSESRRDRANEIHRDVLGGPLADPGLQQWADRLAWVGDVRLAAELAASQTFWNQATS